VTLAISEHPFAKVLVVPNNVLMIAELVLMLPVTVPPVLSSFRLIAAVSLYLWSVISNF
jgi:hypothetical protein